MRIARWRLTAFALAPLAAALLAGSAPAQDQDNSVAAAARRAREQKKEQPKAAHVYDNDTLPSTGGVNVVGQQPAAAGSTSETASTQAVEEKPAPTAAEVAGLNADVDRAKQRLADLKADLDVAQRKFALDQATYVSDPNHSMNKAGAATLDAEKSDIAAKQDAVAAAEKALADAQAKSDAAGKAAAAAAAQEKAEQAQAKEAAAQQAAQPEQPAEPPAPPRSNPESSNPN